MGRHDDDSRSPDLRTHPRDPAAGKGTAIFHNLIRVAIQGDDPLDALTSTLDAVDPPQRERCATVLAAHGHPARATEPNGAVWPCLGSAVWALRTTSSFPDALRAAIDLGADTDMVAAVTSGLAGAVRARRDPDRLDRSAARAPARRW